MAAFYFKVIIILVAAASGQKVELFYDAFSSDALSNYAFDEALKASLIYGKSYSQNNVYVPQCRDLMERRCRFRDFPILYPPDLWEYLIGGACYDYSNKIRLTCPTLQMFFDSWQRNNETFPIPFVFHPLDGSQVFFNYRDTENVEKYISLLFNTRLSLTQWIQCCEDAMVCCNFELNNTNIMPTDEYPCTALWDGWSCVPQARAGETVMLWCPRFSYTGVKNMCGMKTVERYCLEEGMWIQRTNYSGCSTLPMLIRRHEFHVIVLSISIPLSLPAVFILLYFQKLRSLRLILINSLLIAIILKNVLTIISKEAVILGHLRFDGTSENNITNKTYETNEFYETYETNEICKTKETNETEELDYTVLETNSVGCRILAYLENVSENFIFTFMLVNAYYLHKTTVRVFRSDPNIYVTFAIAVVASFIPSTIWAILVGVNEIEECWMFEGDWWYSWVPNGYRFFVLVVNLFILIDILRLLFLKRMKNNTRQMRSAIRGALFLIPLFGGHILLTSILFLFTTSTCLVEDIFIYFTYLIEASQSVLVAFLFCYVNNEVHREIKNAYRKMCLVMQSRYGIKFKKAGDFKRSMAATTSADHTRISTLNRDSITDRAVSNWMSDGDALPVPDTQSAPKNISII